MGLKKTVEMRKLSLYKKKDWPYTLLQRGEKNMGPSVNAMRQAAEKVVAGNGASVNAFLFVGEDRTNEAVKAKQIERAKEWLENNK